MRTETPEKSGKLRTGFTTGSCATAAALAAAELLLARRAPAQVEVTLPKGSTASFTMKFCEPTQQGARAGVVKDAGDDPDVTHGAVVWVELILRAEAGVSYHAGEGVGTVTRAGLPLAVGEPAINPVPREMIGTHLAEAARRHSYEGGFEVTIGVENGAALALKTMNPRLGIVGGLSILGTSGIVRPFSCSAYIASIHQGMDVAAANGQRHLIACTGNTSEAAARRESGLPEMALIEMGDFAGAVLKHARRVDIQRLTLCGGFGKISKLAAGHLDLHSRASAVDLDFLADLAAAGGAGEAIQLDIRQANTSLEALALWSGLADAVCRRALAVMRRHAPSDVSLAVWVVDRQGTIVGRAQA